jgi:hypothetical protein
LLRNVVRADRLRLVLASQALAFLASLADALVALALAVAVRHGGVDGYQRTEDCWIGAGRSDSNSVPNQIITSRRQSAP